MTDSTAPSNTPDRSDPGRSVAARYSPQLAWLLLVAVGAIAIALVLLSISLHGHADNRRNVIEQLTALQVDAQEQNTLVWRAMTQLMANENMSFIRTRGLEQRGRGEIHASLTRLHELEFTGQAWNSRLGFEPAPQLLSALDDSAQGFLASVNHAFGLMRLGREQVRRRLNHWDMNYGPFEAALTAQRERDEAIAVESSRVANWVTAAAALITLTAALLFVASLARIRARRTEELQEERLSTLKASESRFRELVQNSSDLIMVLEPDGGLRYATPSADVVRDRITPELDIIKLIQQPRTEWIAEDRDGNQRVYEMQATDLSMHPDIGGTVINGRDVTDAKALENQLRHQALHDPLTGLPNRRCFSIAFDALTDAQRSDACVLFIDLDGFKLVNDSYGHSVGDQLLLHTANRIATCLTETDLLARQGGDEFIVLCVDTSVAERIQSVLVPPFEIGNGVGNTLPAGQSAIEIFVSASIGIVTCVDGIDAEQAAQRADIAMYKAKEAGKAQAIVFSEDMLDGAPERLALESDFRHALERDEFTVVYQPKVGLKSGVTESLEALVRWIHPTRGFVGPDLFIPFAEESGLVNELGRQVLEKACLDAVRWQTFNVVVAVNLSPIQFRNPNLVNEVRVALDKSGLDPKYLELEITESAVLGDVTNTIKVMHELKSLGIRLAIDDFGTGYSNLAHLKHFDVDVLKIDQAFVRGENPGSVDQLSDGAIVEAVIGMARAFDMHVVAEGVESSNHAAQLKALGADLGQGYYFSKPISGDGIDAFLDAEVTDGRRDNLVIAEH